jgi:ABC-type branched-subunit amino acid transport system substrate-binding protein
MKKVLLLIIMVVVSIGLFACETQTTTLAQGVTDDEILVGNTAVTSGFLAFVGVPFNDAMKAVFEDVNENGGIHGRSIRFKTYDDGFNAANGATLTEKLVEDDKVFALVGHFGTPTVGATLDYIQEVGIPMVYAATGINQLYMVKAPGNPVLAVQPIYKTDGRVMTARAIKEAVYGPNQNQALAADAKIGVLYTNDDVGNGIRAGITEQARRLGYITQLVERPFAANLTDAATSVQVLLSQGVSTIIIAANQAPFKIAAQAIHEAGLTVPVFTSYVNADATAVDAAINYGFPMYMNAWVDVFSEKGVADVEEYVRVINAASFLTAEQKTQYAGSSFAIAGYIAAKIFVEGALRVPKDQLNWENFIAAMESEPFNVPMGGTVDFSGGKRWGITSMALLKYSNETKTFAQVRTIETLEAIEAK